MPDLTNGRREHLRKVREAILAALFREQPLAVRDLVPLVSAATEHCTGEDVKQSVMYLRRRRAIEPAGWRKWRLADAPSDRVLGYVVVAVSDITGHPGLPTGAQLHPDLGSARRKRDGLAGAGERYVVAVVTETENGNG